MNEPAKLELCPLCGKQLTIYGPEDWKPSFTDPDSGGDPYNAVCDCGFSFSNGSYDYDKFAAGLNRRAERTGRWIALGNRYFECSVCHCQQCGEDKYGNPMAANNPEHKQCPCCGAHMIGG